MREIVMEAFAFCCPLLLLLLLIAGVVWLVRRQPSQAAPLTPPANAMFDTQLERLLDGWVGQGRLSREAADQVLALLHEDRARQSQPQPSRQASAFDDEVARLRQLHEEQGGVAPMAPASASAVEPPNIAA